MQYMAKDNYAHNAKKLFAIKRSLDYSMKKPLTPLPIPKLYGSGIPIDNYVHKVTDDLAIQQVQEENNDLKYKKFNEVNVSELFKSKFLKYTNRIY